MPRIKKIVLLASLMIGVLAGWKVGWYELANLELQEDMHNLATDTGFKYAVTHSDDDLRNTIITKAHEYDLDLKLSDVTVQHISSGNVSSVYLAADYRELVKLPGGYSFVLHFTPSSTKQMF